MSMITRALWAVAYLSLMCALVGSLFYLRAQTGELQNQDEWDAWRESDVHDRQTNVLRKRPKSQLPPMTALLQDHFATCLAGAVIFGTALFATFAFMIRGVSAGEPTVIHDDVVDSQESNPQKEGLPTENSEAASGEHDAS